MKIIKRGISKLVFAGLVIFGFSGNLSGKEYLIYPSIGIFNDIRAYEQPKTIDGLVYYNSMDTFQTEVLNSNRLLLQHAIKQLSLDSTLTQDEINIVDKEFQDIATLIDGLDFGKQMGQFTLGVATVDAKAYFDLTWTLVSAELRSKYGNNIKDGTLEKFIFDSVEQIIRVSVDIAIEYSGIDTALFAQFIPKIISKGLGFATAYYDGVLSTVKLINSLKGLVSLSDVQREQYKNSLTYDFIYDYVSYYQGNIKAMRDDIQHKTGKTFVFDSFWSVWFYYMQNRSIIRGNPLYETNIEEYPSTVMLQVFGEAARESLDSIEDYGNGGIFQGILSQYFDINTNHITKTYVSKIKKSNEDMMLYFMPEIPITSPISQMNIGYGMLKGNYHKNYLNIMLYFTVPSLVQLEDVNSVNKSLYYKQIDDSAEFVYVRKVINAKFKLVVSSTNTLSTIEERDVIIKDFYIPSFFDDIPSNYQFMPSIAKLFNEEIISGYKDTTFKPKGTTSIGQFLLMASKALLYSTYKDLIDKTLDINEVTFSKYAEFLNNIGVNIDYASISNYSTGSMDEPATKAYVAKVLINIINKSNQIDNCGANDIYGWNNCSRLLKNTIGISGSMKVDVNNQLITDSNGNIIMEYKPDSFITRDEMAAMLVMSQNYMKEAN